MERTSNKTLPLKGTIRAIYSLKWKTCITCLVNMHRFLSFLSIVVFTEWHSRDSRGQKHWCCFCVYTYHPCSSLRAQPQYQCCGRCFHWCGTNPMHSQWYQIKQCSHCTKWVLILEHSLIWQERLPHLSATFSAKVLNSKENKLDAVPPINAWCIKRINNKKSYSTITSKVCSLEIKQLKSRKWKIHDMVYHCL